MMQKQIQKKKHTKKKLKAVELNRIMFKRGVWGK